MKLEQEQKVDLVRIANQVRKWAYVPYSKYQVGAAVLTESGRVYDGVNIENAAYPVTMCAERVAIFKAVSNGEKAFPGHRGGDQERRHAVRLLPAGDGGIQPRNAGDHRG